MVLLKRTEATSEHRPSALWRPVAIGLVVATVAIGSGAVWLDELLIAVALAPLAVGALLVVTARTVGAFVLLVGATPALVLLPALWPHSEPDFLWLLGPAGGAVLLFGLLLPRLWRFDAAATLIAVAVALVIGVGAFVIEVAFGEDLINKYWTWQGEREARRDWASGRLLVRGGRPTPAQAAVLRAYGITVREIAGCVMKARPAMQMIGYNDAAREVVRARFGLDLRTGCDSDRGVGLVPEVRAFDAHDQP